MDARTFEIRDAGTFIPVLAVKLRPASDSDRYLLARAGYGRTPEQQADYVWLAKIDGGVGQSGSDCYDWPGGCRTMQIAHDYIDRHWDELPSGAVVDVEHILGETSEPKRSECFTDSAENIIPVSTEACEAAAERIACDLNRALKQLRL